MASKRRRKDHKERIHEEMLKHLDENPLPPTPAPARPSEPASKKGPKPRGRKDAPASEPAPEGPRRPRLVLRKLPLEHALETLERFVRAYAHQGVEEVVVVVGKGRGSPGGQPVIAPAVREWLDAHPGLIAGHEEAPVREGGSGAILVRLRP